MNLKREKRTRDLPGVFKLKTDLQPTGDQPQAIEKLVSGIRAGQKFQTLLGVTGSGKTFTMAGVIEQIQRPTLVIAPNKTLAGQLAAEFKAFFPDNAVEYFVSYYDYYQPEAYIAATDTFIEKDSAINDEIDRMRHSATDLLLSRRDVIVVASVSCIYGLGNPDFYEEMMIHLRPGMQMSRETLIARLIHSQFTRNDFELKRGTFRVRGDTIDIYPSNSDAELVRVSFFGDEIDRLVELDRLTGKMLSNRSYIGIWPASHYATNVETIERAVETIEAELGERLEYFRAEGKLVEAYRLEQRTRYDIEMLRETGFTKGIENYSRHLDGRAPNEPPYTLMDFFPDDYLLMIDESHVTVPQIGAMYKGDRSRKESLVTFGFRLPSAFDNRPLRFPEFEERMGQTVFVSATPSKYEAEHSEQTVEQIIRPTGLLDPVIAIHPVEGQIDHLASEINLAIGRGERALVLTLTKKMSEDLTNFLIDADFKVRYLHSDIANDERLEILRDLRKGVFDVLVGINLLREGIDLPEVSLIAILDADREGFLRSTTSLVQIIGRAARNVNGKVVMYADEVTTSMYQAISETNRRRALQEAYNAEHNITPHTVVKEIRDVLDTLEEVAEQEEIAVTRPSVSAGRRKSTPTVEQKIARMKPSEQVRLAERLEREMKQAAGTLDFEEAARLRDLLIMVKGHIH
jgi:excinuclease ABC subunit B